MAVRVPPWLFILLSPVIKAQGADRWDGNDWNKLNMAISRVVKLTNADSPFTTEITDTLFKCDTSSGSITLGLPPAADSAGKWGIAVKTSASNSMTVDPSGSETINAVATISTTGLHSWIIFWSDGTEWWALFAAAPAGGTDELMIFEEGGVQVGSQARKGNFDGTAFNLVEDPGNNRVTVSINFGSGAGIVCQGNDARLSDARTPTAHTSTHSPAGSDPLQAAVITGQTEESSGDPAEDFLLLSDTSAGGALKKIKPNNLGISGGGGGGSALVIQTKSANFTMLSADDVYLVTTGSSEIAVTLNSAAGYTKKVYEIRKVDGGTGSIKITPNGSQKLGLYNTDLYITKEDEFILFYPDGANWKLRN